MGRADNNNEPAKALLRWSILLLLGLFAVPADAYINRNYSSLEETEEFQGDFIDILQQGKLRILLTRDFTSADYLPRLWAQLRQSRT